MEFRGLGMWQLSFVVVEAVEVDAGYARLDTGTALVFGMEQSLKWVDAIHAML